MNAARVTKTYIQDLERCVSYIANVESLKSKSVFITGCNGLICSAVIDILMFLNETRKFGMTIYAATRNVEKTKILFSSEKNPFFKPVVYDALKPLVFDCHADFYIHGAGNSSPNLFIEQPSETMVSNFFGLKEILDNSVKTKGRVLFISSSEIYGRLLDSDKPIEENEQGYVDLNNPRSCYASSKRAAESLCSSYKKEFGVDCVIARPGHIYGPSSNENDKRVATVFIKKAANGEDLILRSEGNQMRSYCYVFDCAIQLLNILLNGKSGEAYNISNPKSLITISEMTRILSKLTGVKCKFNITHDEKDNPMKNSSLSSKKYEEMMKDSGYLCTGGGYLEKEDGFARCIRILKERMHESESIVQGRCNVNT